MIKSCTPHSVALTTFALLLIGAGLPSLAGAQNSTAVIGTDSVMVVAGPDYAAGDFHRSMLGDNYRDIWTTAIKVPVLDLRKFAGGLTPTKLGGGQQTSSVRFNAADGTEWDFRSVHKASRVLSKQFDHTIVAYIFHDYGSASHPLGAIAVSPLLTDAGLLHPNARVAVMPDDPILGKYRKEFAGMLGMIEEYPAVSKEGVAFADAKDIISSDKLLEKMDKDPKEQVDARAMLTARLTDLFFGDNDRHPGQWKWARLGKKGTDWVPIGRDRDKVFVSYGGTVGSLIRFALPSLVTFGGKYPEPTALYANAVDFDRRALGGLDKAVWDSVARSLTATFTDGEIDHAVATLPPQ